MKSRRPSRRHASNLRRTLAGLGGLVLIGTVLAATGLAPAAAAVGWTPTEAPFPADATTPAQVALESLSCPSANWCVAVGHYHATGAPPALIDTFAGGVWTPSAAPAPANAPYPGLGVGPTLSQVVCPANGSCVAVGTYGASALLETLSSGVWTASVAPVPQNAPTGQLAVSLSALVCPAVGSCVAMGRITAASGGVRSAMLFVDTLASGTWTATVEPLPSNASTDSNYQVGADSVSCPAVGWCVAIGKYYDNGGQTDGLIETLSDGTWLATEAPAPPSTTTYLNADFGSVVCPEVGSCEALGEYTPVDYPSGGNGNPLDGPTAGVIETLSGGTWAEVGAPLPSNASTNTVETTFTSFSDVACPSASSCVAVGSYTDTAGDHVGLIEALTGGVWTPTEAPLPTNSTTGQDSGLLSVSCPAAGSCVAVAGYGGGQTSQALTETLAGGTWTAAESGLPSNASGLDQQALLTTVSCPSLGSCVAIGSYEVLDTSVSPPTNFPAGLIETLSGATTTPLVSSTTVSQDATSTITLGQSVTDGSTVTGNATDGSPTGTVTFYVCGPTSAPVPCTYLSDAVGSPVNITAGTGNKSIATSPSFTPSGGGYWCFAAYYSGDANYSASFDASADSCVLIPRTASSTTPASTASTLLFGQTDTALATVDGTATHGSPSGTVQFFDCRARRRHRVVP